MAHHSVDHPIIRLARPDGYSSDFTAYRAKSSEWNLQDNRFLLNCEQHSESDGLFTKWQDSLSQRHDRQLRVCKIRDWLSDQANRPKRPTPSNLNNRVRVYYFRTSYFNRVTILAINKATGENSLHFHWW